MPATAWLLGAGRPRWIIQVFPLINVGCWLILAALLWRLFLVDNWRAWLAWFGLMFSAGVLVSLRLALTDLPALTLVAAALFAAERKHSYVAVASLAAAALTRESSLAAWPAVWTDAGRSARGLALNGFRVAVAATPLFAWVYYVTLRVGRSDLGAGNFAWPVVGLINKWTDSVTMLNDIWKPPARVGHGSGDARPYRSVRADFEALAAE